METGLDCVISGKGNVESVDVIPKKPVYKSLFEKLFWYNLTPKSFIASATSSFETPKLLQNLLIYWLKPQVLLP